MEQNINVLSDTFNLYMKKGKEAKAKGNITLAKRNFLLASETMMQMAKLSQGKLKEVRMDRARGLIEIAENLNKQPEKVTKKNDGDNAKTEEDEEIPGVGIKALFIQGVATSIDALSVGFTIADYDWLMALVCSLIIAAVTFFICMTGLSLGKRFGTKLSNKADILGGVILIAIGLEIFISNMF